MAEYMLFVYENEERTGSLAAKADAELVTRFQQFMAQNKETVLRGQRLHPTSAATSVRRGPDGGVQISDGAFIESKEVVAGYFLIEAANLDEALEVAGQIPVPNGGIEVRPVRSAPGA